MNRHLALRVVALLQEELGHIREEQIHIRRAIEVLEASDVTPAGEARTGRIRAVDAAHDAKH